MSEIRNTKTLFGPASIHATDYSLVFFSFNDQATITSVGLGPDDIVTFETVLLKSGTPDEMCGCFVKPGEMPSITGVETLMCFECGDGSGEEPRPVRLTAANPIVVLNAPQGVLMRAHFSGAGLGTAEVWATIGTDTPLPLLPGMDGCPGTCCIDTEWQENGAQRCDIETDMLQRQEISNCDNLRWVDVRPLNWQDTGGIRCTDHVEEKQQANDCGDLRWVPTGTSCGWIATYELPCGGLAFRPEDDRDPDATAEIDGCGEGEVAYLYPTPMPWASKPITDCDACVGGGTVVGYAFEGGQAACDPCAGDPGAWVRTGVRRWDGTSGATEYGVERQEINGCGHYDWKDDGTLLWVDTGGIRCTGQDVQREQTTEFGQTRWIFKEPQEWRREGSERCLTGVGISYTVQRKELNQCNDSRWVDDRLELWQDTGNTRCATTNDSVIEKQQTTLCGDLRWIASAELQVWSDTGVRSCDEISVFSHEQNQCGRIRKTVLQPVEWVETGVTRCIGQDAEENFYDVEAQEVNQCGQLRWVGAFEMRWQPTGEQRCLGGDFQGVEEQQTTVCGELRWVRIGDVAWNRTGVTRCVENRVHSQVINDCGEISWQYLDDDSCGYLPTYQLPCGGLAFRPTDLRDPAATTVLDDCDGNPQSYIYPTARAGASTPVTDCNAPCPDNPTVLGYAVDGGLTCVDIPEPAVVGSVQIEDQIFALWSNGSKTLIY